MIRYLVILAFLPAYLISQSDEPIMSGILPAAKYNKAPVAESKILLAENPDTDLSWDTTIRHAAGASETIDAVFFLTASEKKSLQKVHMHILDLDLPPPISS